VTWEQRPDRQLEGLELDEIFEDRASGKDLKRPAREEAERYLRRGDVLFARFVRENLCFAVGAEANPMSRLMLSMLGAVAEFERSLILERQRESIALARQRGAYQGRKRALDPDQVMRVRDRLAEGARVTEVARELGVCRQTVYAYLRTSIKEVALHRNGRAAACLPASLNQSVYGGRLVSAEGLTDHR